MARDHNYFAYIVYLFLEDLLNQCNRTDIQLQAYSPLVRGQRFSDSRLLALANTYEKGPAQIILRWVLQLGVSTIPKSSNLNRLKENSMYLIFRSQMGI